MRPSSPSSASSAEQREWLKLAPAFTSAPSHKAFTAFAVDLMEAVRKATALEPKVIEAAMRIRSKALGAKDLSMFKAASWALSDLLKQSWDIKVADGVVHVRLAQGQAADPLTEKARLRSQELLKRNEQLANPSVQSFIKDMERKRLFKGKFVSIFSLMRDGFDLAIDLERALQGENETMVVEQVSKVIDPYLQFVSVGLRCEHTGYSLQDIWRYFRHTWSNQYSTTPGRTMGFLVRDRAVSGHPVIGLGALSSPIVQIRERDLWIGWHPEVFLKRTEENPTNDVAAWLVRVVGNALKELFVTDLIDDGVIPSSALKAPTPKDIRALLVESAEQRRRHYRFVQSGEHKRVDPKKVPTTAAAWEQRARMHLFRSKRALALAELLNARKVLEDAFPGKPSAEGLKALISRPDGRRVISRIVRKAKADRVGIAMADISVCGSIPPYSALLGGKLVCMLAASPEMVAAYQARYGQSCSEIASAMAGRAIIRPAELVFLGTTSLYGVGSSQYNRVVIPAQVAGGAEGDEIRYLELGRSESFGTSHYSEQTIKALVELTQQSKDGQRVNSIFGEGVSPKLRKVRAGMDLIGFPTESLLRHGRNRIVYGVTLVKNVREFLLGIDPRPNYILPSGGAAVSTAIADWWRRRWLTNRIRSNDVLDQVRQHTLVLPIRHGARVPQLISEDPLSELFQD